MGRVNVSSPMGHSWEGITSLDPWITHEKILRSLHLLKTLIESQRSTLEPSSRESFTLVTTHVIPRSRDTKMITCLLCVFMVETQVLLLGCLCSSLGGESMAAC